LTFAKQSHHRLNLGVASRNANADQVVSLLAVLVAALLFGLTLQTHINGNQGPYTIDVGEIQNALPRWGTLHPFGYPLYSVSGSFLVTVFRVFSINPAAGASLVSLLWGSIAVGLLARLAMDLGATRPAALIGALFFAVSRSMWMDSSLAEVHTFTMMLTVATLIFALRFGRSGQRGHLFWLLVTSSNGVVHSRSVLFMVPAVLVLIGSQWRVLFRHTLLIVGVAIVAFLFYLYMPLREVMGEEWIFFQKTTTWSGFWNMISHVKAEDITMARSWSEWGTRAAETVRLLTDDLPLLALLPGLFGVFTVRHGVHSGRWVGIALTLAWLPYALLCVFMWREGVQVHDALLAIKLPVSLVAALGISLLPGWLSKRRLQLRPVVYGVACAGLLVTAIIHYPEITEVTHDREIETAIELADRISNPNRPVALMSLWGNTYWGLAYAQAYRDQLDGIKLVNDRTDIPAVIQSGYALVVLDEVFYHWPLVYWEDYLNMRLYPDTYAPDLIELRTAPRLGIDETELLRVNGDLSIVFAHIEIEDDSGILLTIRWQAVRSPTRDYSIAVHLLEGNPSTGSLIVVAQDDKMHPVEGLYPTTAWTQGQVVQDVCYLELPNPTDSASIRVTAYYADGAGGFVNGNWLTLPVDDS
jgi:hypothetical protein